MMVDGRWLLQQAIELCEGLVFKEAEEKPVSGSVRPCRASGSILVPNIGTIVWVELSRPAILEEIAFAVPVFLRLRGFTNPAIGD
jgi:hypothetical protein